MNLKTSCNLNIVICCFVKGNFACNSAATTDVLCHSLSSFLGWIVFMGAKTVTHRAVLSGKTMQKTPYLGSQHALQYQFAQLDEELTQCRTWRTHVWLCGGRPPAAWLPRLTTLPTSSPMGLLQTIRSATFQPLNPLMFSIPTALRLTMSCSPRPTMPTTSMPQCLELVLTLQGSASTSTTRSDLFRHIMALSVSP